MEEIHPTKKLIKTTTWKLMAKEGFDVGVNQIIQAAKITKGSFYFHFPEGKESIILELLLEAHKERLIAVDKLFQPDLTLGECLHQVAMLLADILEKKNFLVNDPYTRIAIDCLNASGKLLKVCQTMLKERRDFYERKLVLYGINEVFAENKAQFITCALEGGLILSRAQRSSCLMHTVADTLKCLFKDNKFIANMMEEK